ncbi:MAG TPA: RidA family protein [Steroidobacteraceae bacterium]
MSNWTLQPGEWARPKGYANGIGARGTTIFVAGQIGWNAEAQFESDSLAEQVKQALRNIVRVLKEAQAEPRHIVRLTWYLISRERYLQELREIGEAYREVLGKCFPAMSVVEVRALIEQRALVEIEATAVVPDDESDGHLAPA